MTQVKTKSEFGLRQVCVKYHVGLRHTWLIPRIHRGSAIIPWQNHTYTYPYAIRTWEIEVHEDPQSSSDLMLKPVLEISSFLKWRLCSRVHMYPVSAYYRTLTNLFISHFVTKTSESWIRTRDPTGQSLVSARNWLNRASESWSMW